MRTLEGIIVSNVYVLALLLLSTYLYKTNKLPREATRKLVHIGVSNWWFIAMWYFGTALTAAIVPVMFVIVNLYSLKKHLFKSIEREHEGKEYGRLYYAVSFLVLSIAAFGIGHPEIGGIGILIMGYADGFAALIGKRYGKHRFWKNKTVEGTLVAGLISLLIVVSFNNIYHMGLTVSDTGLIVLSAVVFEVVSPHGLDNLTVPLGTALLVYFLI